jgi:hypothetical protein
MDHYSKMILGYSVENSSSPKAIKKVSQEPKICKIDANDVKKTIPNNR